MKAKKIFILLTILCLVLLFGIDSTYAQTPKNKYSTPTITCPSATETSIFLQVCAGGTGAPAGFSVQWMTAEDYAANGYMWYLSDDERLCKASFSGVPKGSYWKLGSLQCVTVEVGNIDESATGVGVRQDYTDPITGLLHDYCDDEALESGTEYVFRAFAHADSKLKRSDDTTGSCSTGGGGAGPGE